MPEPPPIEDDESLLRHIPGGTLHQAPGPRITSNNFKLRKDRNETGVSVTRQKITSEEKLLSLVGTTAESRGAALRVDDELGLGLQVVPKPRAFDHGLAEYQSATACREDDF